MREIVDKASVEWSAETVIYQGQGIGFKHGDPEDEAAIRDAAESLLGYRPPTYNPPTDKE